MEWQHVDLDAKEWRYLVTKTNTPHIVPLCTQAIEILTYLKPLTGSGRFVFPSERTPNGAQCISENTLNGALRRLGYTKDEMTSHGVRVLGQLLARCVFRSKAATNSGGTLPSIPFQSCHAFR
jgi:integrase